MAEPETLFYDRLVGAYADRPDYLRRDWLAAAVDAELDRPDCRFVLIVAEPGAGKTAALAGLARDRPEWLRYFIRQDSTTPLSGGDSSSFLLRVGHQLAARRPVIFAPERLEIVIRQRVGVTDADGSVVGARIEQLRASPFHRTAIQVEQDIGHVAGELVGLEIGQATADPRLLEPDVLTNLALIDPLTALAQLDPSARVVVLVDALDEVIGFRGSQSILEWMEQVAQLPPNVRFVVTSRPHTRLGLLRGARAGELREVPIDPASPQVREDVRSYALGVFAGLVDDEYQAATKLATAADGNFAYVSAYAKGLRAEGNRESRAALLRLDALPVGLSGLYAYFLGMIRREVEQLGRLDVDGDDDERTPAWEGVGQRFLSVLAVARAAVTLDQLVRFGGVRVWRQDAANVLDRMIPFLDRTDGGWRLFHASLAEFLTTGGDVEPARWHRRIVRWYRAGTTRWADVDWTAVDDYGLLHLAEHLTELEQQRAEAADLVNPGLRLAARDRFGTDLPFRRIVDVALAEAARSPEVVEALARTLFLVLVRDGLRSGGGEVPPAVLGLLTRLGRFDEAVARADLLGPGEQQFRSFEAIRACATPRERATLGGHDGVDRLVVAALEVSETESMFRGMERDRCLESAALLLAAHDPQRALRLVASADADYVNNGDSVRREASRHLPAQAALAMLAEVTGPRAIAALDLADRLPPCPEALAFAADHLDSEERPGRIRALARLADTGSEWLPPLLAAAGEAAAPRDGEDDRGPGFDEVRALADAAGILRARHPAAAERILATVSGMPADTGSDYGLKTAARLWAAWGRPERVTPLIDRLLAHYRGLGWYGPADDIAELALIVRDTDPDRATALIDEAVALVTDVTAENDPIDSSRLSNTLSQLVTHLKHWDLDLALRVAGRIQDGWIRGSSWDSASGRSNTLATIALPLVDTDRARAADILGTCLRLAEGAVHLGNPDPLVHHGGLFDVRETPPLGKTATWWAANFITYLSNNVNYWAGGREYLPFRAPIEVLRSIQLGPADRAVSDSWAGVVATAVPAVTVADPDHGHDLVGWIVEPAQRLVAVAGLIDALGHLGDERLASRLPAVAAAARQIPDYRPQIDLSVVSQAPILAYLDPGERARAEAALAVADPPPQITNLARELKSWYVAATHDLERLHRALMLAPPGAYPPDEIMSALARYDEQYDPLQLDLVRCAAVRAMAAGDPGRARSLAEAIQEPWLAALARLHLLDETTDLAAACDHILAGLSSPARRAYVAAHAVQLVATVDDKAAAELLNREADALRAEYPLIAALGLAALAWAASPPDAVPLVREALAKSADEANPYRRNPAIVELLPLAVHTGDPALVAEVVRHLATGGWTTLMGGLVAAVPVLVRDMEPLVALDSAIRQAERALNPGEPEPSHIDGVAHPSNRGDGWLPGPPSPGYLSLFLEQDELPGMRMVQDSRDLGPDSSDDAFSSYGGTAAGIRIWMDEADRQVWRLVDVRWTFPDAARAAGYHEARLIANSEGAAPVPGAPVAGTECHVFGMSVGVTAYYYLFRVGAVVVKLFVARGPQAARDLTPEAVREIAGRIVRRVSASDLGLIDES